MRGAGHVASVGAEIGAYEVSMGISEWNGPPGRPRCRWENNIINLKELGWKGVDWIKLAQDRDNWQAVVNTAVELRIL